MTASTTYRIAHGSRVWVTTSTSAAADARRSGARVTAVSRGGR